MCVRPEWSTTYIAPVWSNATPCGALSAVDEPASDVDGAALPFAPGANDATSFAVASVTHRFPVASNARPCGLCSVVALPAITRCGDTLPLAPFANVAIEPWPI